MHTNDEINSDGNIICETELLRVQSIRTKDGIEEAIAIEWKNHTVIRLSTLLEPDQLAPLFSGGEWAGTRLWDAAIECIHYLHDQYFCKEPCAAQTTTTLLELGCGLGVPGMLCSLMMSTTTTPIVVLTDQGLLLNQLQNNINANFDCKNNNNNKDFNTTIQAKALSWSREGIKSLLQEDVLLQRGFDYVIACDCIYEPLYGESWKLLADVIDELLYVNPKAIVLVSCERRNQDGVDKFLKVMTENQQHVASVTLVLTKENIEIYKINGHELE